MKRLTQLFSFSVWAVCTLRYWFPRLFAGLVLGFGFVALVLTLALSGCAGGKGQPDLRHNAELIAPAVGLDTTRHSATPQIGPITKPGLLARIFHTGATKQDEKKTSDSRSFINPTSMPRKCKGCQFVIQNGNHNTNTQSTTGKKANSATGTGAKVAVAGKKSTQATDSAQALNTGGGAAAVGTGATATGGATTTKPGFWSTAFATVLGNGWVWLLALLVLLWVVRKRLPVVGAFFA